MYPPYRSHGEPGEVIPMLSLCKTWFDVLKFSSHVWGTSSISLSQLWRDSLLFKDFSTAFFHNTQNAEVTSGQQVLYRCFHCARPESMYWNSVSTNGAHLHFQYHSCEEIVYFSRNSSTTLIHCIQHTEFTAKQVKSYLSFKVQDLNRCTEIQYPFLEHIFNFSITAVKR